MDNDRPVTQKELQETLGTFTEETLLPAVSSLMKNEFVDFEKKIDVKLEKKFADFSDTMDDKLADLKGDLIILMRKGDRKLGALVELLHKKHILTEQDARHILSLEPFPKP